MAVPTYLALCQEASAESGVVPAGGTAPLTVIGQTGRLAKIVRWVRDAWSDIQKEKSDWLWMRQDFTADIQAGGTGRYTPVSLGVQRVARWVTDQALPGGELFRPMTLLDPAIGAKDERSLEQISFELWKERYGRGSQTLARPGFYALGPRLEICLGPLPDKAYQLRGERVLTPQELAVDIDIAEIPEAHWKAIVYRALMAVAEDINDASLLNSAARRLQTEMSNLRRDWLPPVEILS